MNIRPLVAALLFALVSGGAIAAQDPSEISRDFFTAYAAGDVERAASYWKSSAVEKFRAAATRTAAARCFVIRDVDVRAGESTSERARVELDARAMSWSAIPAAVPVDRSIFRTIELESEGGVWKIVSFRDREDALASQIAGAPPDQREMLSRGAGTLRTPLLASLLTRRAITAINRLQFDDAAQLLDLAEDIAIETGDGIAESEVLSVRGTLMYKGTIRDYDAALSFGERAIALAEATKDADAVARALLRHGRVRSTVMGKPDSETFERIVALTDLVEEVTTLSHAHTQLLIAADLRGEHRETFRHSMLVDKYARETGDIAASISAATGLGGAFHTQGDDELAAVHYARGIELATKAGFRLPAASLYRQLAMLHRDAGRFDEFLKAIDDALAVGEDLIAIDALVMRASHRIGLGEFAAAEADLKAAQEKVSIATEDSRDWLLETRIYLLVKQGRCEEALKLASDPCNGQGSCGAAFEWVSALTCLGRKEEANAVAMRILADTERRRAASSADVSQRSMLQERRHARVYEMVVELLVDQQRFREALTVADRSKARILAEALSQSLLTANRLAGSDRVAYDRLDERIRGLNRAMLDAPAKSAKAEGLREELENARTEMRELFARADAVRGGGPSGAPRSLLDEGVPAPPANVVVIEYVATKNRLLAFAVIRSASGEAVVTARAIPIATADLTRLVDRHLSAIEQRDFRVSEPSRELYDLLLAPFDSLIRGHQALCVVPSGDLWRVPFHALKATDGRYLIETTSVFYAPSIATFDVVRSPRAESAPATILAVANPNIGAKTRSAVRSFYRGEALAAIPETEQEVRALAQIYGPRRSRVLVGEAAQESALKRESPNFSVLHIAAHGVLDENAPWFSALALASADDREDGLLEAREIAELPLRADLAVLSACDTGRGRASAGEGIIGFSWALLAAGCPNAVVSQWRAESQATMELMIDFHRDLVKSGRRSPSESLRRAQLSMMRRHAHPYYWAPFIVVGRDR